MTATMDELFSDEVFTATDLARGCSNVLDQALCHPVTISRNAEQFALLRRDHVARMVRTMRQMRSALSLLPEIQLVLKGSAPSPVFDWLRVYEKDDVEKLLSDLLSSIRSAAAGNSDWRTTDALIYEWKESALIAESGVIEASLFCGESDETPLPDPRGLMAVEATDPNHELECRK